jgi:zinc protease
MLRDAKERGDSPDGAVTLLADSLAFSGHPYGLHPAGTERSLAALTPDAVRRFVRTHFVTSRMLVVIVGNVSRERVERDVASTLGRAPRGQYVWHLPPPAPDHPTSLTVVARSLSTNYLLGYFHGPAVTQADYPAFEVATLILSNRLNEAIRGARGLSYAADAPYIGEALATGGVYVSTDAPDEVVPLIREEIETCRRAWVPQVLIDRFVEWYITQYLMRNETNEAQAHSLARAQIYLDDYRRASHAMAQLRHVTPADIIRVSQRYMHDIRFAYIGDPVRIKGVRINGI